MKTLKISDETHRKLTATLGTLMAETGEMQTYQDAIEDLLSQSVILITGLLIEIENFMEKNRRLGFTIRDEFMRDAARWRLKFLKEDFEYIETPRERYERLEAAVKGTSVLCRGASEFIHTQVKEVLEKYDEWLEGACPIIDLHSTAL